LTDREVSDPIEVFDSACELNGGNLRLDALDLKSSFSVMVVARECGESALIALRAREREETSEKLRKPHNDRRLVEKCVDVEKKIAE
jgi:hypothetical protein